MSSILEMITAQLDANTVKQVSQQLSVDEQTAQQAINMGLPMLMGALNRNATTPEGAQALDNALQNKHDGSILGDVAGALNKQTTQQQGMAILGHVLGNKQNNVAQGVSQASGLDVGSSNQLLSMLAPLVMGALGQQKQQQGLDAAGLASLLLQENQAAESSVGGLLQILDMDGDGEITDDIMEVGSKLFKGWLGG